MKSGDRAELLCVFCPLFDVVLVCSDAGALPSFRASSVSWEAVDQTSDWNLGCLLQSLMNLIRVWWHWSVLVCGGMLDPIGLYNQQMEVLTFNFERAQRKCLQDATGKKKRHQKLKDEVVTTDEDDDRIGLGLQVGINPKQWEVLAFHIFLKHSGHYWTITSCGKVWRMHVDAWCWCRWLMPSRFQRPALRKLWYLWLRVLQTDPRSGREARVPHWEDRNANDMQP